LFFVELKLPVANLKIGSTNHTVANLPSLGGVLNCDPSTLANIQPNTLYRWGNFNTTSPIYKAFVYRVNDSNQKKLTVEYPTNLSRNVPVNGCGFSAIDSVNKASGFSGTDRVKINGTEYTVSNLPLAPNGPLCRNGVNYQPQP
jgi:hypothetical protein